MFSTVWWVRFNLLNMCIEVEEEKNGYDRRQTPLPRHSLLSQLLPVGLEVAHFFNGYQQLNNVIHISSKLVYSTSYTLGYESYDRNVNLSLFNGEIFMSVHKGTANPASKSLFPTYTENEKMISKIIFEICWKEDYFVIKIWILNLHILFENLNSFDLLIN